MARMATSGYFMYFSAISFSIRIEDAGSNDLEFDALPGRSARQTTGKTDNSDLRNDTGNHALIFLDGR